MPDTYTQLSLLDNYESLLNAVNYDDFSDLRVRYGTIKYVQDGYVLNRLGRRVEKLEGVPALVTKIGTFLISEWSEKAIELIERYGEGSIYEKLLKYSLDIPSLKTRQDRIQYALQLHISRMFDNEQWAGFRDFHNLNPQNH